MAFSATRRTQLTPLAVAGRPYGAFVHAAAPAAGAPVVAVAAFRQPIYSSVELFVKPPPQSYHARSDGGEAWSGSGRAVATLIHGGRAWQGTASARVLLLRVWSVTGVGSVVVGGAARAEQASLERCCRARGGEGWTATASARSRQRTLADLHRLETADLADLLLVP